MKELTILNSVEIRLECSEWCQFISSPYSRVRVNKPHLLEGRTASEQWHEARTRRFPPGRVSRSYVAVLPLCHIARPEKVPYVPLRASRQKKPLDDAATLLMLFGSLIFKESGLINSTGSRKAAIACCERISLNRV